jgi:hypothetical protein
MAIAIKTVPTLKNEEAIRFDDKAKEMTKKKSSVDFSKQINTTAQILAKSKI